MKKYARSSNFKPGFKPRSMRRLERKNKRSFYWTVCITLLMLYLFFFWGLPYLIKGLAQINKKTTLIEQPISEDAKLTPPVFNIPYEATNTATIQVDGYGQNKTKVELYVNNNLKETVPTDDNGHFEFNRIDLSEGENYIYGKTISETGNQSLSSKSIRVFFSNEKPKLEVLEPEDNKTIEGTDEQSKKVMIRGKTNPDNTLTINGTITIINPDGSFSQEQVLTDGENIISIKVINSVGNATQIDRKIIYTAKAS